MGWIVAAVIVCSLVALVLVCLPVLNRMRGLERAVRRLEVRARQAQSLQAAATRLAATVAGLERSLTEAAEHPLFTPGTPPGR